MDTTLAILKPDAVARGVAGRILAHLQEEAGQDDDVALSLHFIDGSVVHVALPAMQADLDARFSDLQWIVNGYTLALAHHTPALIFVALVRRAAAGAQASA